MCTRIKGLYLTYVARRSPPKDRLVLEISKEEDLLQVEGNRILAYLDF
jgi:hypothetical protein